MAEITTKDLPTAEENPEAWNILWVANRPVPGTCLPIEGERLRDVEHKKSKGSTRDILVDQGMQPTECTIKIRTYDATTFRSLYDFYQLYMSPDRPLSRQTVVPVWHPQLYARGITLGYFYSAPLPQPTEQGGIRPYISTFKFKIVGPKTQINDSSTSSKPKQANTTWYKPTENLYQAKDAYEWVALMSSEKQILPGVFTSSNQSLRPQDQQFKLYTPADVQKKASAGDKTADFINMLSKNSTPAK